MSPYANPSARPAIPAPAPNLAFLSFEAPDMDMPLMDVPVAMLPMDEVPIEAPIAMVIVVNFPLTVSVMTSRVAVVSFPLTVSVVVIMDIGFMLMVDIGAMLMPAMEVV
jgi:hypothetical protein